MFEVQQYLRSSKTVADLKTDFGINADYNEDETLVLLKYHQLESPKTVNIVRECRSLVLEVGSWDVVSYAFYRFFNYGENDEQKVFNWNNFTCTEKADGSFITAFNYKGEWFAHTRGMVNALGPIGTFDLTFKDLFFKLLGHRIETLNPDCCYTFELCSIYNKVVRQYDVPKLYLLSSYNKVTKEEVTALDLIDVSNEIDIATPQVYEFKSYEDIEEFLTKKAETDPTFEGVVVRDDQNRRLKIKSISYLKLHHFTDREALFSLKNLVPLVLIGEIDEIVTYVGEAEFYILKIKEKIEQYKKEATELYESVKDLKTKKEWAMKIKGSPFSGFIFRLYDNPEHTMHNYFHPTISKDREQTSRLLCALLKDDGMEQYAVESIERYAKSITPN